MTSLCIATLVARGLVEIVPPFLGGGLSYKISTLGHDVLAVVQEYANEVR